MKEILAGAKYAKIDDEDFEKVNKYHWWSRKSGNTWHAGTRLCKRGSPVYMHELIMGQAPFGFQWDHKNLDGLDNQKINLRLATPSQNRMNRIKYKNNTSGYKGVVKIRENVYRALIRKDGIVYYLGMHQTAQLAAYAYDTKAVSLFGEFARLNFSRR